MHISICEYIIYNVDNRKMKIKYIFESIYFSHENPVQFAGWSISEIIHDREYQLESGAIYKL